jgi:23S rRNA (uracil1939-C5)-methyltransferase
MEVTIEKIVPDGKSLAHIEGKAIFVLGGLPGEVVEIEITKDKKTFAEAKMLKVVKFSPDRIKPAEGHYLICSLDYDKQIEYKKALLTETYLNIAGEEVIIDKFSKSEQHYGYRTKLEFSFTTNEAGQIALAFHKRSRNNEYEVIDGCKLGSDKMNLAAHKITELLNNMKAVEAKGLKSLTIRESKTNGQIIAVLLHKFREYEIQITLDELKGLVDGLIIGYSTIKSPVSVITDIDYQEGITFLEEKVLDKIIRYPYDGFFQNNLPVFEQALREIREVTPDINRLVELYSGTGSIGFNLTDKAKEIIGVEIVPSAVEYAAINKKLNNVNNYTRLELPDHKLTAEILDNTDVLVLDPPRAGLHQKVIEKILITQPKRIIYLSCNPVTQARDYSLLREKYDISSLVGLDFYPNTLHMESLLVLNLG